MAASSPRPHVLFLMSDEHRADVTGYEGNSVIRTPVLDRIAGSGVVFRNAYTPSPICVPGRQCLASGQLPRTCGCEVYGQDLPPFSMTFAKRLAQFGYVTACAGKLHHCGADYLQGWTDRMGLDSTYFERKVAGTDAASFERFRVRPPDFKWSDAREICRAGAAPDGYDGVDRYNVDGALRFIERYFSDIYYDRSTPAWPLMLKVSLNQPHYPYLCDAGRFAYYLNRVEPFIEHETFPHPFLSQRAVRPGVDVTPRDLRRATAAYYGMIDRIDAYFGEILDRLEALGQDLDDWIIIYTSDHGEMLGEHGIWEKQKFFEASVRVPLIIRYPRRFQPRLVRENVNLCDLFATLCDLCGVPLPSVEETVRGAGLDSRALTPLLEGTSPGWSDESISQFGGINLMIKRGGLKYQSYGPDQPEVLFDLGSDPGERRNAIDDSRHAAAVSAFRRRREELGF